MYSVTLPDSLWSGCRSGRRVPSMPCRGRAETLMDVAGGWRAAVFDPRMSSLKHSCIAQKHASTPLQYRPRLKWSRCSLRYRLQPASRCWWWSVRNGFRGMSRKTVKWHSVIQKLLALIIQSSYCDIYCTYKWDWSSLLCIINAVFFLLLGDQPTIWFKDFFLLKSSFRK